MTRLKLVGNAIAQGNVTDLDINLLCTWIMNKGNEVQQVCDKVEQVAKKRYRTKWKKQ